MPYIIPTNENPTFWNKDNALGALIGTFVAGPFGLIAGGAIGGFLGKSKMENELETGKVIKEPTFWNKDAAIGAMLGVLAGGLLVGGVALIGGLLAVHTLSLIPIVAVYAASVILPLAGGVLWDFLKAEMMAKQRCNKNIAMLKIMHKAMAAL